MDAGIITIRDINYIRVSNLTIIHSSYAGLYANTWGSNAVSHIEFLNNSIEDTTSPAVLILGGGSSVYGEGCKVLGNKITNAHNQAPTQNHEVISIAGGQTNFEIANNIISHSFGGVIDCKDGVSNGLIHDNIFTDNSYSAIYIDGFNNIAQNIEIYNNEIYNAMQGGNECHGINMAAEGATGITDNINIHHNKIHDNPGTAIRIANYSKGIVRNITITDNQICTNGGAMSLEYTRATNIIIDRNYIYGNGFDIQNAIPGLVLGNNIYDKCQPDIIKPPENKSSNGLFMLFLTFLGFMIIKKR